MEVVIPLDSDGFLSRECPSCNGWFKIQPDDQSAGSSYCTYCGFEGEDCWLTQSQVAYVQAVAHSEVLSQLKKTFGRSLQASTTGPLSPPIENDGDFSILTFKCCNNTIKANISDMLFCTTCGRGINMSQANSKRIFLSHKGIDKDRVIDFKKCLEAIGYAPWLDDDDMPAGTSLERGLLEGFQSSCAVVFFITPSFADSGYLQTEIDYAIKEKRKKGDKFAIIAIQFVGEDGGVGEIPGLLESYVWKKPKTDVSALREIIRALPVSPGIPDWKDGFVDVALTPKVPPKSNELCVEAMDILKAAVSADGTIMYLRTLGGESLQVGNRNLIPDQSPRTIAKWIGGLEDLQRRRYIKSIGTKGEVFEVTREGFDVAEGFES